MPKSKEPPHQSELLPETSIDIRHPKCGSVITVLKLSVLNRLLIVRGICPTCQTYVDLRHENKLEDQVPWLEHCGYR